MKRARILTVVLALLFAAHTAWAAKVEVLHWWTSGGESKAVGVLKQEFEKTGNTWVDSPIAGGGGEAAMTVLKSRVVAGDPPTAVQIKGPAMHEWGEIGALANLNEVAKQEKWDQLLPPVVSNTMKYKGNWVGVPVNVHRVNWIWVNPEVFRKAGATVPTTWNDFFPQMDKVKAAGFIPIAHGGQAWQDATMFEEVVLGYGGADFYRKVFVDLDDKALTSKTMVEVFDIMRKLHGYIDKDSPGRDWNLATAMVINGKAGMQFMGDWAKGEFLAAGKKPGTDFLCMTAPGSKGSFIFNIDSFAMFKQKEPAVQKAQATLAKLIMGPSFQETFNLYKGSIPARLGVSRTKFDSCAHDSMDAFVASSAANTLVPSMAHDMATKQSVKGAMLDVVTNHFNSTMSSQDAVKRLSASVKAAR
jgi:glucose/mannose transport system substrate-binding protein